MKKKAPDWWRNIKLYELWLLFVVLFMAGVMSGQLYAGLFGVNCD